MTGSGNNAQSFGFTWTRRAGFRSISAPGGRGTTTINGVNDAGDLVGFYTGPGGRTHGLLWDSGHFMAPPAPPVTAMPIPSMSARPTMSATPTMTVGPTMTAIPTMAPTMAPTAPPVPNPSASPPGGPW
jgi:hypothetical protein